MKMETFTKTFTNAIVEVTYRKSDGYPFELRLTVPGMGPNISEECALRNAHKLKDVATDFTFNI
jgi:hypothetical protein